MRFHRPLSALLVTAALAGCAAPVPTTQRTSASMPTPAALPAARLVAWSPAFHDVVVADARIEVLAEGFTWAEGPAWLRDENALLFTDVPENRMHRWSEADGLSVHLAPSGYAGPDTDTLREAGANGLLAEPDGTVLLADSGNRLVARFDPGTREKTHLATQFEGRRLNSPNDIARRRDGTVFFTDPPYGLAGLDASPVKEQPVNGVYRLDPDGALHRVVDDLSFPNGIALSPDERTLYVANSDPARPIWMAYPLEADGRLGDGRVFADAGDLVGDDAPGLPDGMVVAADGTLFATGPGGVLVFAPDGTRLGRIETGHAVSNCTFGDDGRTLYMTSDGLLARVRVRVGGQDF